MSRHCPQVELRQVWREHDTERLVVVVERRGVVRALCPEHSAEVCMGEAQFRLLFDFTGHSLRSEDPDAAPSAIEAATVRGLTRRPSAWLGALVAEAERQGENELADMARQVLALRGELPGTREGR